ncbi:radical SAM protein [Archaeoglobales archaeon]|nr:MAG: radical SAM protein [Archaeoglobales archaeon]
MDSSAKTHPILREYEENGEKVFVLRNFVEIRIPIPAYESLVRRREKEYVISYAEPRRILSHITKRNLIFVTKESGIPLMGSSAFGLIDRGTNLIQIRPVCGCNLRCIFCSVDEGKNSKTRATDYLVDPDYMLEWITEVARFKGKNVEAHIDGQGEPFLYPYIEELLEGISRLKEIDVVSIQTNGILLSEKKIERLENLVTRINLSLSSLDEERASKLAGVRYPLNRIIDVAKAIAESKIDLLIAPVWVPGYNDGDMEEIIEFALEIGAGKKYPPLGIQKYIPYKFGRKLKNVMPFREFYAKLEGWEKEYGVKLILKPEDFGMYKCKKFSHPIKKGDVFKARIVAEGRMHGEKLVVVKNRVVTVRTNHKTGDFVKFRIVRSKDGIFLGEVLN